ncbi:hypothetical protein CC78DRAFT_596778 [Lojkania enalia]|uniref:Uncharacterized protein n=1 Tax=Lojkania enalia TaxID=147567 RepID=A0A9P4KHW7_9PLEO|nr:hypothetical protein CC78DRAFT_596778 [Didymosphaeria enalia]
MQLLQLLYSLILVGSVAGNVEKQFEFEPRGVEPAIGSVELPRLEGQIGEQSLASLFARQNGNECMTAAGQRFGCAPNKCTETPRVVVRASLEWPAGQTKSAVARVAAQRDASAAARKDAAISVKLVAAVQGQHSAAITPYLSVAVEYAVR